MGYLKHLRLSKSSQQKNPVQINEQDLYLFADFVVLVRGFGSCPHEPIMIFLLTHG